VDREPAVQLYAREYEEPRTDRTALKGAWRMTRALSARKPWTLHLAGARLNEKPESKHGSASVQYLPAASHNGGLWDAGVPFCQPGPQNADEACALNFTSPPLEKDLYIFGNPRVVLYASTDAPVMPFAVRLTEVGADGTSVLVTRGILNGTRRFGMKRAKALEPGKVTALDFELETACWKFSKGNAIRVSVNGSDFPNVWPTPYAGHIALHWGQRHPTKIELPIWDGGAPPAFAFKPSPQSPRATGLGARPWQIVHDVLEDQVRLVLGPENEFGVSQRTPAVAWAKAKINTSAEWPGCQVRAEATGSLTSNARAFHMNLALNVYLNGALFFQKQWSETVKRELL